MNKVKKMINIVYDQKKIERLKADLENYLAELHKAGYDVKKIEATRARMQEIEETKEDEDTLSWRVCAEGIFSLSEQKQIAQFDEKQLYTYLFNNVTVFDRGVISPDKGGWILNTKNGLNILPENENDATLALEKEIIGSLKVAIPLSKYENFIKRKCGEYPYCIEWWKGKRYAKKRKFREKADENSPWFEVISEEEIEGPRFFATAFGTSGPFFVYHPNEIIHIAPEKANAYELGEATFRVYVNSISHFDSPLIAGKTLEGAIQENCNYFVSPIKFYKIKVDKTRRLEL